MNDYTPTDEQIRNLVFYAGGFNQIQMEVFVDSPAFRSITRAAQAEARYEAAAVLESVIDFWRADPDNWRFETAGDTRNWLMDVAADMRAGRPIVLSDDE